MDTGSKPSLHRWDKECLQFPLFCLLEMRQEYGIQKADHIP